MITKEIEVTVEKLTDVSLLRRANSFTTQKESKMSLENAYKYGHSPIRTQQFWVELKNIPLYVASQLVRSKVGVQHFQLSKRTDRGGEDFYSACQMLSRVIETQVHNIKDQAENGMVVESDDLTIDLNNLTATATAIKELPERFDRFAPTDLAFICNAEALINMAHKRLCKKASFDTQQIFKIIVRRIASCDKALVPHLIPQCVYRGLCPEPQCCGYIKTENYKASRSNYSKLYENGKD